MHVDVTQRNTRRDGEAGFTLVEMMLIVMIIGILGGMATAVSATWITRAKADGAITAAVSTIEVARNRAIAERRNIELHFEGTDRIRLARQEPDGSVTTILNLRLENGLVFRKLDGITDTPDEFGASDEIDFDGPDPVMFTSDGSLVDANGDPSNGTILFARGNDKMSARAITLFGMTGLIQAWRWVGAWAQL